MWGIKGLLNNFNPVRAVPFVKPEPPPAPKPQPDADAKIANQKQLAAQLRNKLERLDFKNLPKLTELQNLPTPERIAEVARKNAPFLVLPSDKSFNFGTTAPQNNLPADPNEYIANSQFREDVPFGLEAPDFNPFNGGFDPTPTKGDDKKLGDNINDDQNDNFTPADLAGVNNDRQFLDLNNDKRTTLGKNGAPIFYQFQKAEGDKPAKLTYHIFYGYNDAPRGTAVPIDLNHEGDWERVTYELNDKLEPVTARLSAHKGGSTVEFKNLQKEPKTGRPMVFVANGSHANYVDPDVHPIYFKGVPASYDVTAMDENGDGKVNVNDNAAIFDTAANLNEVTSQPWYPKTGNGVHWGEIGEMEDSTGPFGPSKNKGAA